MSAKLLALARSSDCPTQLWGVLNSCEKDIGNGHTMHPSQPGIRNSNASLYDDIQASHEQTRTSLNAIRKRKLSAVNHAQERVNAIQRCLQTVQTVAQRETLAAKAVQWAVKAKIELLANTQTQLREQIVMSDWTVETGKWAARNEQARHTNEIVTLKQHAQLAQDFAWRRCVLRLSAEMELCYQMPVYCDYFEADFNTSSLDGEAKIVDGEESLQSQQLAFMKFKSVQMVRNKYPNQCCRVNDVVRAVVGEDDEIEAKLFGIQPSITSSEICLTKTSVAEAMLPQAVTSMADTTGELTLAKPARVVEDAQWKQMLSADVLHWLHPPSYYPAVFSELSEELNVESMKLVVESAEICGARIYVSLEEWISNAAFVCDDERLNTMASFYCGKDSRVGIVEQVQWLHDHQYSTTMQAEGYCGKHRTKQELADHPDILQANSPNLQASTGKKGKKFHFVPATRSNLLATSMSSAVVSQLPQNQRTAIENTSFYSTIRPAFKTMYIICNSNLLPSAKVLVPLSSTCMVELLRVYLPQLSHAVPILQPCFLDLLPTPQDTSGRKDRLATSLNQPRDDESHQQLYIVLTSTLGKNMERVDSSCIKYLLHVELVDGQPSPDCGEPVEPRSDIVAVSSITCCWRGCTSNAQTSPARFCVYHARVKMWTEGKSAKPFGWQVNDFAAPASLTRAGQRAGLGSVNMATPETLLELLVDGHVRQQHMKIIQDRLESCRHARHTDSASWRRWRDSALAQRVVTMFDWQATSLHQIASMEHSTTCGLREMLRQNAVPISEIIAILRGFKTAAMHTHNLDATCDGEFNNNNSRSKHSAERVLQDLQRRLEMMEDEQWRTDQKLRTFEHLLRETNTLDNNRATVAVGDGDDDDSNRSRSQRK